MRTIVKSECSKVSQISVGIIGTDKEIFGADLSLRVKTRGRPKVNRELAYKLIKAGYSTRYICRVLKCRPRTVRLMRKELEKLGEIEANTEIDLDKIELEFDDECVRAVGISFFDWLKSRTKKYKYIFNFCRRVWEKVWDKPSLVLLRDYNNPLGDQLCMKFLEVFGEDKKRIRNRKITIRFLFRFLGRTDLCDRYLTVSESRDPRPLREIPEISLLDFPERLDRAINLVGERLGEEYALALRFKIVTQMRTGEAEKELMGIKVGDTNNGSWIIFNGVDEWRSEILAKKNEKWILTWIPRPIREELYRLYEQREQGEPLFKIKLGMLRKAFKEACKEVGLPPLRLHDLRKVAITWLWAMGVPLEFATEINVGWKDLNTAKRFYLQMRRLLRKTERQAYRENIPEWFKEGLDEYLFF